MNEGRLQPPAGSSGKAKAGVTSASASIGIDAVALNVKDIDVISDFYRDVIGLRLLDGGNGTRILGVGSKALVELRSEPEAHPETTSSAGLFHTAFLLPDRDDLKNWLAFATSRGVNIEGASDHLVSEAIYLSDPEGNGIEIYVDRPSEEWVIQNDMIEMRTDPLDVRSLAQDSTAP